jgi:hypothetical protein
MSSLTDYGERLALDVTTNALNGEETPEGTRFVALYTEAPGEGGQGVEVQGEGYSRKEVRFLPAQTDLDGITRSSNVAEVLFDEAESSWGTVVGMAILDQLDEAAGNDPYSEGTTYEVSGNQADFIAAIANAEPFDTIAIPGTLLLDLGTTNTPVIVIDKPLRITGPGELLWEHDPISTHVSVLIKVTSDYVYFDSNLTITHRRLETKHDNDVTILVESDASKNFTVKGFTSKATVNFSETGYQLMGSFDISGNMNYVGVLASLAYPNGNDHRPFYIYQVEEASRIANVNYDFPQTLPLPNIPNTYFIHCGALADTNPRYAYQYYKAPLVVANNQHPVTFEEDGETYEKVMRQFFVFTRWNNVVDNQKATFVFMNNYFNDKNGGIVMTGIPSNTNPFDVIEKIILHGNTQGPGSRGTIESPNHKGLAFLEGGTLRPLFNDEPVLSVKDNVQPGSEYLRPAFTPVFPSQGSALCYNNTNFSLPSEPTNQTELSGDIFDESGFGNPDGEGGGTPSVPNIIWHGTLNNPKAIDSGDQIRFPAGSIVVSIS